MFRWLYSRLFGRRYTLICMRQVDTWTWPPHLGKMTPGECEKCRAPVYYEAQNWPYRKICHICAEEP